MPESRLAKCRALYAAVSPATSQPIDPHTGFLVWMRSWDTSYVPAVLPYRGSFTLPVGQRCLCGAAVNEPHAPECYQRRVLTIAELQRADDERREPIEPTAETPWAV